MTNAARINDLAMQQSIVSHSNEVDLDPDEINAAASARNRSAGSLSTTSADTCGTSIKATQELLR